MKINFGYGKNICSLDLKGDFKILDREDYKEFNFDLKKFLEKIEFKGEKIGLIFPDTTRPLPAIEILNEIYPKLKGKNVKIFIGTGTHRKPKEEELKNYLGEYLNKFDVIINDPEKENLYEKVGETKAGTQVMLLKEALRQDEIFGFTVCRPHYYAGFSGGRKIFVPGIAFYNTIQQNHHLVLDPDPKKGKHKKAVLGVLEGNPVHIDMVDALNLIPVSFKIFNFVILKKKMIYGSESFDDSVKFVRENFELKFDSSFDTLIISAGGNPFDINFIQGHKCLEHSIGALRENGNIYAYIEAKEGFGSKDCTDFLKLSSIEKVLEELRKDFKVYGHTALTILMKAKKFNINLHTNLSDEDLNLMGYKRWDGITIPDNLGRIGVIRQGSIFYFQQ